MDEFYKILEVDKNATDEEIKKAYITLKRKYDPDSYEKESLKQHAKEKMEQITNAFDAIMNDRRASRIKNGKTSDKRNNNTKTIDEKLQDVQMLIENNNLQKAEELLMCFSNEEKNARWYYLKGIVLYRKGWISDASNFFETAVRMDPTNIDYKKALEKVNWQKNGNFGSPQVGPFGGVYPNTGPVGCSFCDICGGLMCLDFCCDCGMPRGAGRCC